MPTRASKKFLHPLLPPAISLAFWANARLAARIRQIPHQLGSGLSHLPPLTGWQSPISFFTWKKTFWKTETDLRSHHLLIALWLKEVKPFSQETTVSCLRLQRLVDWTSSGLLSLTDYISILLLSHPGFQPRFPWRIVFLLPKPLLCFF